jgi:hypothetical protein
MGYYKAIGIEVQRNCRTVNILDLHLQTKEYSETHNLATRRQFPSTPRIPVPVRHPFPPFPSTPSNK